MATPKPVTPKKTQPKKRNFSSFKNDDAFRELNLENLTPWPIDTPPLTPSRVFKERLDRLQDSFDLSSYEESKKLLIDAICEEAIQKLCVAEAQKDDFEQGLAQCLVEMQACQ